MEEVGAVDTVLGFIIVLYQVCEKMSSSSSKTLIRTGVSLISRLMTQNLRCSAQTPEIANPTLTSRLFPSLYSQSQSSIPLNLPQSDVDSLKKVSTEGFLYPTGLPSLPFFLPDGKSLFSLSISIYTTLLRNVGI